MDFELIVSNGGEPEHTRRLAKESDPRVHWVEYDRTSGMLEHSTSLFGRAGSGTVAFLHDTTGGTPPTWRSSSRRWRRATTPYSRSATTTMWTPTTGYPDVTQRLSVRFGRADRARGYYKPFFDVAARQSAPWTGGVIRRDALQPEVPAEMSAVDDLWTMYALARTGGAALCKERLLYRREHARQRHLRPSSRVLYRRHRVPPTHGTRPTWRRTRPSCGLLSQGHLSAGAALLREHARAGPPAATSYGRYDSGRGPGRGWAGRELCRLTPFSTRSDDPRSRRATIHPEFAVRTSSGPADRRGQLVLFADEYSDLDPRSTHGARAVCARGVAWTWELRDRQRVVELPEPLWLRALPFTYSIGLAFGSPICCGGTAP